MFLAAAAQKPIGILATPKTGNLWIKYVLVNALGMRGAQFYENQEIVDYFNDRSADRRIVFHAHVPFGQTLQNIVTTNGIRTISLVRNPLDIFLSLRSHVARLGPDSSAQADILSDDPETIREFARTYFLGDLAISAMWARRGAIVVRYEDLLTDPVGGFAVIGRKLGVGEPDIEQFAAFCDSLSDIREMRSNADPVDREHFTSAEVDKWRLPANREMVSNLLQSQAIRSAMRLWGYDWKGKLQ